MQMSAGYKNNDVQAQKKDWRPKQSYTVGKKLLKKNQHSKRQPEKNVKELHK